jgi:SAM-dependent methyltransferase
MPMSHHHEPHDHEAPEIHFTQEFWDERYRSADRLWSGQPNAQLVAQVADLEPGDALDVGSGEGADAIWLAARGWMVTAVDISAVALERAAAHASASPADISARITWQREDLLTWDPGRQHFDLVSAQYMHLPSPLREDLQARLAAAVRPGGTLLIVGHHADDMHVNVGRPDAQRLFASAGELAETLDPDHWQVLVADAVGRPATDLDGQPVTVTDAVLRAVRRT